MSTGSGTRSPRTAPRARAPTPCPGLGIRLRWPRCGAILQLQTGLRWVRRDRVARSHATRGEQGRPRIAGAGCSEDRRGCAHKSSTRSSGLLVSRLLILDDEPTIGSTSCFSIWRSVARTVSRYSKTRDRPDCQTRRLSHSIRTTAGAPRLTSAVSTAFWHDRSNCGASANRHSALEARLSRHHFVKGTRCNIWRRRCEFFSYFV